jgi:lipoprotein-anchoring transpeptidase ErfK/SrfK
MIRGRHAKRIAGGVLPILLIALCVLAVLGGGATFVAYKYDQSGANRILPGVSIDGVDVGRMARTDAIQALKAKASERLTGELVVKAAGRSWTVTPRDLGVRADVAGAVDQALAISGSLGMFSRVYHRLSDDPIERSVELGWRYNDAKVNAFVKGIADEVAAAPRNAGLTLGDGGAVVFTHAENGRELKSDAASATILSDLQAGRAGTVTLPMRALKPKVTDEGLGATLVINKESNQLSLYEGFRLDRTYAVATAMAPFETPSGTWTIIDKAENPTWTNPAPDTWGAGLPASIPPGPGNPLGTRALYLNAPGIRIHGTYDSASIGTHASHGCIRMNISDVEELYPLVPIGTTVLIY